MTRAGRRGWRAGERLRAVSLSSVIRGMADSPDLTPEHGNRARGTVLPGGAIIPPGSRRHDRDSSSAARLPGTALVHRRAHRNGRRPPTRARWRAPAVDSAPRDGHGQSPTVHRVVLRAVVLSGAARPAAARHATLAERSTLASGHPPRPARERAGSGGRRALTRRPRRHHRGARATRWLAGCSGLHDDARPRPLHVGIDGPAATGVPQHARLARRIAGARARARAAPWRWRGHHLAARARVRAQPWPDGRRCARVSARPVRSLRAQRPPASVRIRRRISTGRARR